jgi:transposase
VRKLRSIQPQRVWRLECQPGEELQLDFGLGAPIKDGQEKARRTWVLRMVLSYSRKGYSEAVIRQDTETFLRCLENGLRSLGGSPLILNLDNMKTAVLKADWFDPEINPIKGNELERDRFQCCSPVPGGSSSIGTSTLSSPMYHR